VRLTEVFGQTPALAPLITEARATDDLSTFQMWAAEQRVEPRHILLWNAVRECALKFAEMAGISSDPDPLPVGQICFGAQQPYVDYYPAVLAKLDALEECAGASFYGFGDYATFGSDLWMARTEMPGLGAPAGLLRLYLHSPMRAHEGKDLRFVPVPSAAVLSQAAEELKQMITLTAKWLPVGTFSKKTAFERLRLLLHDYEEARLRSRNAGEFNSIWSARVFRRLGFRLPLLLLSDLLSRPELLPSLASTLAVFIKHNRLFVDSVNEALRLDGADQLHFTGKEPGHLPLALASPQTGVRRPLRLQRAGSDWLLVTAYEGAESFNVGSAEPGILEELLQRLRGRWSLDVFAPVFLMRLGITGIINGRGSVRYSLIVGRVMRRLFGESHVPNLLCSCAPPDSGPFADAVRRVHHRLPAGMRRSEPTLIARLLYCEESTIRREIAASWRNGEEP
jgi:hypothetical protein